MKLGVMEKTILKKATASLEKFLKEENGHIVLKMSVVNNWLAENGFPFEIDSDQINIEISLSVKQ